MTHNAHKYKRIKFKSGHTIFRCMLPGCAHFIRKEMLMGRLSICWRCKQEHVITDIELAKQHCDACTKSKKPKKYSDNAIDTLLSALGG